MNVKLRKTEVNLVTLGTGVIFFGAWAFIKLVLTTFLYDTPLMGELSGAELVAAYIILFLVAGVAFLIHFYIGMSARAEGKGKRKSLFYIILTGIIVLIGLPIFLFEAVLLFAGDHSLSHIIITLIIEATSQIIMLEVFIYAIKVRWMRRKEAQA